MAKKSMYEIFQREALFWQDFFGLYDWKIYFDYKKLNVYADILMNWPGRTAIVRLSKSWTRKLEYEVRRCAFHEVCHLLISEVSNYSYHQDAEEHQHQVIRRLENSVFDTAPHIMDWFDGKRLEPIEPLPK